MQHTTVTLGRVTYFLTASSSSLEVEAAVVEALRLGGGYVTLALAGGRSLEVLVSPGIRLVVGTAELSDEAA